LVLKNLSLNATAACVMLQPPQSVALTLYRMVTPIGTPFLKEKINN